MHTDTEANANSVPFLFFIALFQAAEMFVELGKTTVVHLQTLSLIRRPLDNLFSSQLEVY